tara:strand:- start:290 stop:892 length:603 start_codon:yes stop_codon:yes gene_type:complete
VDFDMKKRTAFIGTILSLISFGQPLLIKTGVVLSSSVVTLSISEKAQAQSADFYIDRANEKFDDEDYYGAISEYNRALKINPYSVFALSRIGRSKYYLEDYKGALQILDKAVKMDENYKFSFVLRGDVKFKLEDYYGAISDYNKSIKIDANDLFPYYFRGLAKKEIGDTNGACSDMKRSLELSKNNKMTEILNKWIKNYC